MMLINIAFFLFVAAIIIAFLNPKSKMTVWITSIIVPILLSLIIAVIESSLSDSSLSYPNKLAWSFGSSLISVIVSMITLFSCLNKKFRKNSSGEKYLFPKALITAIIILLVLGLISEWGTYNRNEALGLN